MKSCVLFLFPIFVFLMRTSAQETDRGNFSGNFQTFAHFYERDDRIGANTEVYLKAKSSLDAWMFLNYDYKGYSFAARFDAFQNSPLLNPQGMYSKQGLGFWQASKDFDKFNVTAGYFYEQFGSGMLFRAYEDRNIGIDYAIQGVKIKANLTENLRIKAFSGQQKGNIFTSDRFGVAPQVITGINAENRFKIKKKYQFDLGGSAVNRVLDNSTMNRVVSEINSYPLDERFIPYYNVYSFNGYGTLTIGDLSLFGEYCYKTPEAMLNQEGDRLFNSSGNIIHTSASYSKMGLGKKKQTSFGINTQYKRIENFTFRTSPYETLLNGMIAYLPSITRQNAYRLLARYNSVVQELGEQAFQAEFIFTPKRGTNIQFNYSYVESLAENGINGAPEKLFEEIYVEFMHKIKGKKAGRGWTLKGGTQVIFYNQARYEIKPGYENVSVITPFAEAMWKYSRKNSMRLEVQYMSTKQDLGSFVNAVLELNLAPKWSFAIGDMVNVEPYRQPGSVVSQEIIHYYSAFVSHTRGSTVMSIAYIKQVEGVNCTGGICRVEPAFSGLRFTMNTAF